LYKSLIIDELMFDFIKLIEIFFNTYLDLNDREQPDPPVQNVTDSDYLKTKISELFLVEEMPKEFYDLWSFCKRQSPSHPEGLILL
jgi:hypothetical protein